MRGFALRIITHLYETHRSIHLLPETHPLESGRSHKQVAKTLFQVARGVADIEVGWQVPDIEGVDLLIIYRQLIAGSLGEPHRTLTGGF